MDRRKHSSSSVHSMDDDLNQSESEIMRHHLDKSRDLWKRLISQKFQLKDTDRVEGNTRAKNQYQYLCDWAGLGIDMLLSACTKIQCWNAHLSNNANFLRAVSSIGYQRVLTSKIAAIFFLEPGKVSLNLERRYWIVLFLSLELRVSSLCCYW